MKVKVGDKVYSAEDQPVMIILTDKDKKAIADMVPGATKYCAYPESVDQVQIINWMKET